MLRLVQTRLSLPLWSLMCTPACRFAIRKQTSHNLHLKYVAESFAASERRQFLQRLIINKSKLLIQATRRLPSESLISLRDSGRCAGVIRGHEGEPDLDVVMPGGQLKSMMRRLKTISGTVYVRVEGQDILCVIQDMKMHPEQWIQKVELGRLVAGKPTEISVPIILTNYTASPQIQNGCEIVQKHDEVRLLTYNEDFPTSFAIDITYLTHERPYRFADLANTFPPGLELSPKHRPLDKIVMLLEAPDVDADDILENFEDMTEKLAAEKEKKAAAKGAAAAKQAEAAKAAQPKK